MKKVNWKEVKLLAHLLLLVTKLGLKLGLLVLGLLHYTRLYPKLI